VHAAVPFAKIMVTTSWCLNHRCSFYWAALLVVVIVDCCCHYHPWTGTIMTMKMTTKKQIRRAETRFSRLLLSLSLLSPLSPSASSHRCCIAVAITIIVVIDAAVAVTITVASSFHHCGFIAIARRHSCCIIIVAAVAIVTTVTAAAIIDVAQCHSTLKGVQWQWSGTAVNLPVCAIAGNFQHGIKCRPSSWCQ